jgi:hypothetical protein
MEERISLLKKEVEERGCSWTEFQGTEVRELGEELENGTEPGEVDAPMRSNAWTDGTLQAGRIVNGEIQMDAVASTPPTNSVVVNGTNSAGGRLDDEALRRAMEDRMRELATGDDDDEGMHL